MATRALGERAGRFCRMQGHGEVREGGAEGPSPDLACRPTAERGKTLVQKKPTMYPEWRSTFDAHVYEGRVIQVVLMRAAEEPLSEATVGVSVLAERCKKNNGKAEFWLDLQPQAKVLMSVQYFLEDVGKSLPTWAGDGGSEARMEV